MLLTYEERLNENTAWALEEGGMYFDRRSAVHETLTRLAKTLDELNIDYAIAGAMALFLHGFRRFTEDVDVIVTRDGLERIHEALDGRGYVRPFEKSKNLRDTHNGVRIDFIISGQYPGDGKAGPVAFPIPNEASTVIDGVRIISLPKLVELKLASGQQSHRIKDLGDVQGLIEQLHLPRQFANQLDPSLRDAFQQRWDAAQKSAADEY
jgi:hypothetical protein